MRLFRFFSPAFAGWTCAVAASAAYGLNPLFAVPLYRLGLTPDEVLFYRYSIAAAALGIYLLAKRSSFRLTRHQLLPVALGGVLMACSSLFLFLSYCRMEAGVASTILFVYPVMVAVIMGCFFHEKITFVTGAGMALALAGVAILCRDGRGAVLDAAGIVMVLLSALTYAVYLVGNKVTAMREIPPAVLVFYGLLFGQPIFWVRIMAHGGLTVPAGGMAWLCIFALALLPTVVSLGAIALAIRLIGATPAALTGALEPATAVLVSVLFLGETMSWRLAFGIVLVVAAVFLVAGEKPLLEFLQRKGPFRRGRGR